MLSVVKLFTKNFQWPHMLLYFCRLKYHYLCTNHWRFQIPESWGPRKSFSNNSGFIFKLSLDLQSKDNSGYHYLNLCFSINTPRKKSYFQGTQESLLSIQPFIRVSLILCLYSKTKKHYHIPQNSPKSHPHDVCCSSVTCSVCTLYWSWLLLSETDAEFLVWPAPVSEPQSLRAGALSPYLWCLLSVSSLLHLYWRVLYTWCHDGSELLHSSSFHSCRIVHIQ